MLFLGRGLLLASALFALPAFAASELEVLQQSHAELQRQWRAGQRPSQRIAEVRQSKSGSDPHLARKQAQVVEFARWLAQQPAAAKVDTEALNATPLIVRNSRSSPGDECRQPLGLVENTVSRIAMSKRGEPHAAIWLRWQAPAAGSYRLSTRGSALDSRLERFESCASIGSKALAQADDEFALNAEMSFEAGYPGQPFLFRASNLSKAGDLILALNEEVHVKGQIRSASSGLPLSGVQVSLTLQGQDYPSSWGYTDDNGDYSISIWSHQPGQTYYLRSSRGWSEPAPGLQHAIWPGRVCRNGDDSSIASCPTGELVVPPDSDDVAGINLALADGVVLNGRVLDVRDDTPIPNTRVILYLDQQYYREVETDAAGRYRFSGLVPTRYGLSAEAEGFEQRLFDDVACNASCDPPLGSPLDIGDHGRDAVDLRLQPKAYIEASTRVDGEPIDGNDYDTYFVVFLPNGVALNVGSRWDSVRQRHLIGPLPIGHYRISARRSGTYAQLSDGIDCAGDCSAEFSAAADVEIARSGDRPQVNFDLRPYASLRGHVDVLGTAAPVVNAEILLVSPNGDTYYGLAAVTDNGGNFAIEGIPPGRYFVVTSAQRYFDQISNGIECEEDHPLFDCPQATAIEFSPFAEDQVFNVSLQPAAVIHLQPKQAGQSLTAPYGWYNYSLRLLDSDRQIVDGYSQHIDATTGAVEISDLKPGQYHLGLRLEGYFPQFVGTAACPLPERYVFDPFASCDLDAAEVITFDRQDIQLEIELSPYGRRQVRVVRDDNDAPLAGVNIDLWNEDGQTLGTSVTDSQGQATVDFSNYYGANAIPVRLSTDNYLGLLDQVFQDIQCPRNRSVYRGGCSLLGATPIELPSGDPTAAPIDFRLRAPPPSIEVFSDGFE